MSKLPLLLFVIAFLVYEIDSSDVKGPRNSYIQSVRHFLQDLKNMAGGFMSNRLDRLEYKRQMVKQKVKEMFRKWLKPFKKSA